MCAGRKDIGARGWEPALSRPRGVGEAGRGLGHAHWRHSRTFPTYWLAWAGRRDTGLGGLSPVLVPIRSASIVHPLRK